MLRTQPGIEPALLDRLTAQRSGLAAFLDSLVRSIDPDLYGVVLACPDHSVGEDRIQNCPPLALLARFKSQRPDAIAIFGGVNCEGELGAALQRLFPFLDYVCIGEGKRLPPPLIHSLLSAESAPSRPGLLARESNQPSESPVGVPPVLDLDELPYPDYDDFFSQFAAADLGPEMRPYLLFETSRGCWWGERHHCTFCGLNGAAMRYRSKSPRRSLDELDYLVGRHGVRALFATDMILDPATSRPFCQSSASAPCRPVSSPRSRRTSTSASSACWPWLASARSSPVWRV